MAENNNLDTLSIGLRLDVSSLDADTKKALKAIENIDAKVRNASDNMSQSLNKSTDSSNKLNNSLNNTKNTADKSSDSVNNLSSNLKTTKKTGDDVGNTFNAVSVKIAAVIKIIETAIRVVQKMASAVTSCVEAADQNYSSLTRLNTVLGNIYGTTSEYTKALDDYVDGMEKAGVVSGDALIQATQTLSSYTTSLKQVEDLLPAVADLAAALYGTEATTQNAQALALAIGRALDGSADALARYGVKLSDETKKILSDNTVSRAEKVNAIVKDIEKSVGGMNETLGKSYAGQISQIKAYLGDIQENLGYIFKNFITPLLPAIKQWVSALRDTADLLLEISKQVTGIDSTKLNDVGKGAAEGLEDASKEADKLSGKLLGFDKFNALDSPDSNDEKVDTGYVSDLLNKGNESVSLADKAKEIIEKLDIPKILEGIKTALTPIWTLAKGIYDGLIGIFSESGVSMAKWSTELSGFYTTLNSMMKMLSAFIANIGDLFVFAVDMTNEFIGALFNGENTVDNFEGGFAQLSKYFFNLFDIVKKIINLVKPIIDPILSFVGTIVSSLFNMTTKILSILLSNLNKLLNSLRPITNLVSSLLASGLDSLLKIVSTVLTTIFDILGETFELVEPALDACMPLLEDLANMITDVLAPAFEIVQDLLSALSDQFKDAFGTMKNITGDFVDVIKGLLTGDLSLVFKGFGNIFVDVLNGICNGFKDFMDWIVNTLNASIGWLNSIITAFGGDPIGIPNTDKWGWKRDPIPRFADGGLPDKGSLFVANEEGPELVANIGGESAVANNKMIVDAIEQAAYTGFLRALKEGGGSNINISIDGSEMDDSSLVRAIMPALKAEVRKEGGDDSVLGR